MTHDDRVTLKQVRAITAVAECRGIAQAAGQLNTTQPVISRAIASAEKLLGVSLFQRGWEGTEPTAQGEPFLARCRRVSALIEKAEDHIDSLTSIRPNLSPYLRWHHLQAAHAVVKYGSASHAARALKVTQPAISRALTALSDYTKQPLFNRTNVGLKPTPTALRLSEMYQELQSELADLDLLLTTPMTGLVGRLAVGMLPFSGQDLVAMAFGDLVSTHSHLRLMAVPGSYNMLAPALHKGEIDCTIGMLRNPSLYHDLDEALLYHERFALIARKGHPCHKRKLSMQNLRNESWVVAPHGTPLRTYFDELFLEVGVQPPIRSCEIHSFVNAERMVMHSDSIALLSYSDAHLKRLPKELKALNLTLPAMQNSIGLTFRKADKDNRILQAFKASIRSYMH